MKVSGLDLKEERQLLIEKANKQLLVNVYIDPHGFGSSKSPHVHVHSKWWNWHMWLLSFQHEYGDWDVLQSIGLNDAL